MGRGDSGQTLKTDLPNYARLVRNLNLELATLFSQLCRNLCHLCALSTVS